MAESTDAERPAKKLGSRREREFRRYGEVVLGMRGLRANEPAASSRDVSLTAFAQLVALRLNVKRALISLFDKDSQYVLAEATQTLSLQDDEIHDGHDGLNWGNTVIPRGNDFASETLTLARRLKQQNGTSVVDAALIVPSVENHDRFSNHPHVIGAPFVRSFAGIPLLTSSGFPIGTLSIMHDQPRPQGLTEIELKFMRDVGTSIMKHIEMKRTETAQWRGTRMVQGLSRFMEGKDSIAEENLPEGSEPGALAKRQSSETSKLGASQRTYALNNATNSERLSSARDTDFWRKQASSTKAGPPGPATDARRDSRPSIVPIQTAPRPGISLYRRTQSHTHDTRYHPSVLQENTISKDVPQAFGRAAGIIRQAMDMAGVVFLDATAGEFGSLRSQGAGNYSPDTSETGSAAANESGDDTVSSLPASKSSKPCRYLGTSYQASEDGTVDVFHHNVPERFLRSVLRRFPHGKIYNFGDDGLLPSEDGSDSNTSLDNTSTSLGKSGPKRAKRSSYTDSLKLQKVFPGARALGIMPMWDNLRSRFFAGAVVWTYDRTRLFSFQEDLNYLGAFCDVVMAEVTRLDIQADVRAKSSFIASISHELRSPLHGILGGVEVLQEEDEDIGSRQQMINMIDTCGRSLLDIVNNLLEHAHETSLNEHRRSSVGRGRKKKTSNVSQDIHDLARLAEEVLDSALWQTPQPAAQSQSTEQIALLNSLASHEPLKVVFDLDSENLPDTGWAFHINAGAFRRILQNLTTNAIKYTDRGGYFKVALSVSKPSTDKNFREVTLVCADSGRGMSKEYLKDGLFQAFNQEDSHTQGTGLGLNLVKGLIEGMAGTIDVQSNKGEGTTITLKLPLTPGRPTEEQESDDKHLTHIRGLKYSLSGFGADIDQGTRASEASDLLKDSIEKIFIDLGMTPHHETDSPDVYVLTEARAITAASATTTEKQAFQINPCIIFCHSISSSRTATALCASSFAQAQVVTQPLGPRQLIKALIACLDKTPTDIYQQRANLSASKAPRHIQQTVALQTPISEASEMSWTQNVEDRSRSRDPSPRPSGRPSIKADASAILVVDDNPVNLHLLQRYVKKIGRLEIGATNGQEALEAYERSHRPQTDDEMDEAVSPTEQPRLPVTVVFMDITMPIMDGLESTRRIRAFERAGGLKPAMIVALTAMASPEARQEAYSSGVDLFLTKPVRFKEIQQMFKDWEVEMGW